MNEAAKKIQNTYLILVLLNTLAASLIWGINTLFLLDAGLSNTQAFAANAFFTAGMVLFEVPTGVIADTRGRRISFLLGTITLSISTLLYLLIWEIQGPFWAWAVSSVLLGLGFTFFSGAVEAWVVDALKFHRYKGNLDSVFAKGQIATGIAMLSGSVAGGLLAQATNLGVPYIARAVILVICFTVAFYMMFDRGFSPQNKAKPLSEAKRIFSVSIEKGLKNRPVRWLMLSAPFSAGVGFYAFYAMQPYLLRLYGDPEAYSIAGLVAAIVAGAQITGGLLAVHIRRVFKTRTSLLLLGSVFSSTLLIGFGFVNNFFIAVVMIIFWALIFAAVTPVRLALINGLIPSKQRATVLSFDSLMGSSGGVVFQPVLGKSADVWSYSASYMIAGAISIVAWPFIYLAKREKTKADPIK